MKVHIKLGSFFQRISFFLILSCPSGSSDRLSRKKGLRLSPGSGSHTYPRLEPLIVRKKPVKIRFIVDVDRVADPHSFHPDTGRSGSGSRALMTKNWKKNTGTAEKKNYIFLSITTIYLSLGLHKERPSYRWILQLSKEAIQLFKTWT
jgi:hypothetical protein